MNEEMNYIVEVDTFLARTIPTFHEDENANEKYSYTYLGDLEELGREDDDQGILYNIEYMFSASMHKIDDILDLDTTIKGSVRITFEVCDNAIYLEPEVVEHALELYLGEY